uniref:Alpha-dioxygenase 2 n=1 Tax=Rhizophora mucronata TaxID=61149 RepID=A0A2P2KGC9_RHIMU
MTIKLLIIKIRVMLLKQVTYSVMFLNKYGLQQGESCPAVPDVSRDRNPLFIMLKQAISRYL